MKYVLSFRKYTIGLEIEHHTLKIIVLSFGMLKKDVVIELIMSLPLMKMTNDDFYLPEVFQVIEGLIQTFSKKGRVVHLNIVVPDQQIHTYQLPVPNEFEKPLKNSFFSEKRLLEELKKRNVLSDQAYLLDWRIIRCVEQRNISLLIATIDFALVAQKIELLALCRVVYQGLESEMAARLRALHFVVLNDERCALKVCGVIYIDDAEKSFAIYRGKKLISCFFSDLESEDAFLKKIKEAFEAHLVSQVFFIHSNKEDNAELLMNAQSTLKTVEWLAYQDVFMRHSVQQSGTEKNSESDFWVVLGLALRWM